MEIPNISFPINLIYTITLLLSIFLHSVFYIKAKTNTNSTLLAKVLVLLIAIWFVSAMWLTFQTSWNFGHILRDTTILFVIPIIINLVKKSKVTVKVILLSVAAIYSMYLQPSILFEQNAFKNETFSTSFLIETYSNANSTHIQKELHKLSLRVQPNLFNPKDYNNTDLDDYILATKTSMTRKKEINSLLKKIRKIIGVEYVEINEEIRLIEPSQNELVSMLKLKKDNWLVNDEKVADQWALSALKANTLYEQINKAPEPKKIAKIFILDTGIDANHEDLQANYKSLKSKYDTDSNGHGTHCAGIAAGVSNNRIGIASLTPTKNLVSVTSIKVLSSFGAGSQKTIIRGIIEAADNGADVISMSLGGFSTDKSQKAYSEAVKYANDKGAIVIVAAGNSNADAINYAPANADGVLCVAALEQELKKAPYSNTVDKIKMAVSAPGSSILSTWPNNKYEQKSGTSMATPYVSGLVGILKAYDPHLNTEKIYHILNNSAASTLNEKTTGKLIQPTNALKKVLKR